MVLDVCLGEETASLHFEVFQWADSRQLLQRLFHASLFTPDVPDEYHRNRSEDDGFTKVHCCIHAAAKIMVTRSFMMDTLRMKDAGDDGNDDISSSMQQSKLLLPMLLRLVLMALVHGLHEVQETCVA